MAREIDGGELGKAYFMPLEPLIENGQPFMPIYYYFPHGRGDDISEDSALIRPLRKAIRDGKLLGKISYVFYKEKESIHTLGSFAYAGRRIIFFPAIKDRRIVREPDGTNPLEKKELFYYDHFTLEENWLTWHVSLEGKIKKYQKMSTKKINDDFFLWFVLGVKNSEKLELMPKTQEIRLTAPNIDELRRRYREIADARESVGFPIVELQDDGIDPHYLNFEVFISTNKLSRLEDFPEVIITDLKGTSATVYDARADIMTRVHQVILPNFDGIIWIRVSKINGVLPSHAVIMAGSN